MGNVARAKLQLIPWDGTSQDHVERMFDQRVACGWKSEEVEQWPEMSAKGMKALYWIVRAVPGKMDMLPFPCYIPSRSSSTAHSFSLIEHC